MTTRAMDKKTRKRLEAAGFRVGDAEDFLELTEEERRLVELRLAVSRAVRSQRKKHGVTQKQLAKKLRSSQSRVAKIEAAAGDVSLDLSLRALFAAGGGVADLVREVRASGRSRAGG
jgi:ribosome-binding protein aMBF1 (putative translation factor)